MSDKQAITLMQDDTLSLLTKYTMKMETSFSNFLTAGII